MILTVWMARIPRRLCAMILMLCMVYDCLLLYDIGSVDGPDSKKTACYDIDVVYGIWLFVALWYWQCGWPGLQEDCVLWYWCCVWYMIVCCFMILTVWMARTPRRWRAMILMLCMVYDCLLLYDIDSVDGPDSKKTACYDIDVVYGIWLFVALWYWQCGWPGLQEDGVLWYWRWSGRHSAAADEFFLALHSESTGNNSSRQQGNDKIIMWELNAKWKCVLQSGTSPGPFMSDKIIIWEMNAKWKCVLQLSILWNKLSIGKEPLN